MPSLPHVPPALHPGRRFRSAPPGVRPPAVAGLGAFRDPALCARRTWRAAGVRCGPERPVPAAPRGHVSLVRRGTRSCRFLRGWGLWRALGPTLGRRRRARACPGSPVRVRRSVVPSVQAWESPATGPGDACVAVSLAGDATRSASVAAHSARGLPWRRGRGRGAERPAQGRRGRTRLPEIATRAERGSRPAPAPPPRGRSCLGRVRRGEGDGDAGLRFPARTPGRDSHCHLPASSAVLGAFLEKSSSACALLGGGVLRAILCVNLSRRVRFTVRSALVNGPGALSGRPEFPANAGRILLADNEVILLDPG